MNLLMWYMRGTTQHPVGENDRRLVTDLHKIFLSDTLALEAGEELPPIPTESQPTIEYMKLHLECCKLLNGTEGEFSPFPNTTLGRTYQRLCS